MATDVVTRGGDGEGERCEGRGETRDGDLCEDEEGDRVTEQVGEVCDACEGEGEREGDLKGINNSSSSSLLMLVVLMLMCCIELRPNALRGPLGGRGLLLGNNRDSV